MLNFMKLGGQVSFPMTGDAQMSIDKLLKQYEKQLLYEGAKDINLQGNVIAFSGIWLNFKWTGKFLKRIDRGFIRIFLQEQKLVVSYRLSFNRFFYGVLLISLFISLLILGDGANIASSFKLFLFLSGLLLGLNLVTILISIQVFIRSVWSVVFRESSLWKILYVLFS